MKRTKNYVIAFMLSSALLLPVGVFAGATADHDTRGDVRDKLNIVAESSGIGGEAQEGGLVSTIGLIIQAFLTVVGVLVTILIIYSGYLWMTAQGNADQVTKAKTMMTQAVIGLAITMAAYFISDFVVSAILDATA